MKHGARNKLTAKVTSIESGDIMSPVLTTESVEHLELRVGDEVQLVIKAIHVLPVKE